MEDEIIKKQRKQIDLGFIMLFAGVFSSIIGSLIIPSITYMRIIIALESISLICLYVINSCRWYADNGYNIWGFKEKGVVCKCRK